MEPSAHLRYSSDGRAGQVHYLSHETRFALYYEFGAGDCIAFIEAPDPDSWQQRTGLPLERRDAVLAFIAQQVAKDQTAGGAGRVSIEGDWISIHS
jgi:hypothetical protein